MRVGDTKDVDGITYTLIQDADSGLAGEPYYWWMAPGQGMLQVSDSELATIED